MCVCLSECVCVHVRACVRVCVHMFMGPDEIPPCIQVMKLPLHVQHLAIDVIHT